jgi:hypothetical protein
MILTVTVHKHCAPQTLFVEGATVRLPPGVPFTADFSAAQEAIIRACPGHFAVSQSAEPANAAEPAEPATARRGRPRKGA